MSIYWGARIDGEVYGQSGDAPWDQNVWNTFEQHTQKDVSLVEMGQPWLSFDQPAFQAARNRGAFCLLTMGLQNTTLDLIARGKQDKQIRNWANKVKTWGYPFLFRPWWEMNGAWYPEWGRSPDYAKAWRRFHTVASAIAPNITWTWCVNSIWAPEADIEPYWPGEAYVDWVGIDAYNHSQLNGSPWRTPTEVFQPTIDRIREITNDTKPMVICETASSELGGNKAEWIDQFLGTFLPNHTNVKGFCWFNWNILESSGQRKDWPIESSIAAQEAFRSGIQNQYFYNGGPQLNTKLVRLPSP